jgi:Ni/Fe-hydrogenase subunit HybB-like protein
MSHPAHRPETTVWARQVETDMLGTLAPMTRAGHAWIAGLSVVLAIGFGAYVFQLFYGLGVTALNDYVSWGVYMANFVFFIGISYAGTLISAVLRLVNADWRRPITRMAETITVVGVLVGALMIVIDMGRPDRLLTVFTSGRPQSPILWDVAALNTYLLGSILYLYVAMIPDLQILARKARELGRTDLMARLYEFGAMGFSGTKEQHRRLDRALGAMAVVMIPVAISAHSVVSWIFGVTLRPGWHSTIFGPYFVVGAIFSGTAGIITAMAVFRRVYRLERYIRVEHFQALSRLLLALTLLYGYFTLSEYLTIWYGGQSEDAELVHRLMGLQGFGLMFWPTIVLGLAVPSVLLLIPMRRSITTAVVASLLINVGMWMKRYLIVVPTMMTPVIPAEAAGAHIVYSPTWVEWAVTLAGVALFLLLFTLFSRVVPIISIWEMAEAPPNNDGAPTPVAAGHTPPASSASMVVPSLALLLSAALLGTGLSPRPAWAGQATPGGLTVTVERETEAGEDLLIATVLENGQPKAGVRVSFFVRRLFGPMPLGHDTTLPDGTAAVDYPVGLPASVSGALEVEAHVIAPELAPVDETGAPAEDGVAARGSAVIPADVARADIAGVAPRALWSSRAPVPLILTISAVLLAVWCTYAFVIWQVIAIRRHSGKVVNSHQGALS